jgi:hypothetical protein
MLQQDSVCSGIWYLRGSGVPDLPGISLQRESLPQFWNLCSTARPEIEYVFRDSQTFERAVLNGGRA